MKRKGRGFSCMFYPIGVTEIPNSAAVVMKVNTDGSAVVSTGASDIGQGSTTVSRRYASPATASKW